MLRTDLLQATESLIMTRRKNSVDTHEIADDLKEIARELKEQNTMLKEMLRYGNK